MPVAQDCIVLRVLLSIFFPVSHLGFALSCCVTGTRCSMYDSRNKIRRAISNRLALPMVTLAFIFLILTAYGVHRTFGPTYMHHDYEMNFLERCFVLGGLGLLWPLFIAELVAFYLLRDRAQPFWRKHWRGLLVCLFPPLRMGATSYSHEGYVWIPWLGWQQPSRELRKQLEKAFSVPMIMIALLVLPVLVLEFGFEHLVARHFWLAYMLDVTTACIYVAFANEFIIMVSIAKRKWMYVKSHWIDLAIIVLPWISFLRSMRLMYIWRLAYLQNIAKMSRLYRLRGLGLRLLRALLLLGIVERVLGRNPEKRLARLEDRLELAQEEVEDLQREIAETQRLIALREGETCGEAMHTAVNGELDTEASAVLNIRTPVNEESPNEGGAA